MQVIGCAVNWCVALRLRRCGSFVWHDNETRLVNGRLGAVRAGHNKHGMSGINGAWALGSTVDDRWMTLL